MKRPNPRLYLIPTTLGESPFEQVFPPYNEKIVSELQQFIVENTRSARRFLKKLNPQIDIDSLTFFELNQHTDKKKIDRFLDAAEQGEDIGLLSEAGCPAVADPGADIVAIAQQKGLEVYPLVGPSSILLSLMASGFNGQNFAFLDYLPIQVSERSKTLKKIEMRAYALRDRKSVV